MPVLTFPKERLEGDTVSVAYAPVPLNETVCEPPEALSVMVSVAARVPEAAGVKLTEIVQLAPPAKLLPQVLL